MGDVAKGTWIRVKHGVFYQGIDISNKLGVVIDSESYIVVQIPDIKIKIKLLRTEIAEYLAHEPSIFDFDDEDWYFSLN